MIAGAAAAYNYGITDVSPPQAFMSYGTGINSAGQVTGYMWTRVYDQWGFVWNDGGVTIMPAQGSKAYAINNQGDVTGWLSLQGVIWNPNGMMINFFSNGVAETGLAINESRAICGEYYMDWAFDPPYAFRYTSGQMVTPIAFPGQTGEGSARGINAAGHITGWSMVDGAYHMFLWRDGALLDCGLYRGSVESGGFAISETDLIAGFYGDGMNRHAVLYDAGTATWTPLPEPPGALASEAHAMNSLGQFVGTVQNAQGDWRAAFWPDRNTFVDLNDHLPAGAGWVVRSATGINSSSQIVGDGNHAAYVRAFLMTPALPCDGDVNHNGQVDLTDLSLSLAAFGACVGDAAYLQGADFDLDGCISLSDLARLLALFGGNCP